MMKIDFHIHTVSTVSDVSFVFNHEKLVEYVTEAKLDAIAITNHNVFDKNQFLKIKESIKSKVFPGIEINLDGGHLLLISEDANLDDFDLKCGGLSSKISQATDSIDVSKLREIFGDLSQYLLIPHYEKTPAVPDYSLADLGILVTAGEVSSPKKFMYCLKDTSRLVPVLFSDCRISLELKTLPIRHTYIACGDVSLRSIKHCLMDRSKISLSLQDGSSLFPALPNGQQISSGLTVIIGERSSGKSYTLKKIDEMSGYAKYIRQFSLVATDEKTDQERFDKILSQNQSLFTQDYLKEFQGVINDIIHVDLAENERKIVAYLESLKKNASESERFDAFAKANLFREEEFASVDLSDLKKLITSVQHLIENVQFRSTIQKHLSIEALRALIVELMLEYGRRDEEKRKQVWLNELITDIKRGLQRRTAVTVITEVDFYKTALDVKKSEKFNFLIENLRRERELMQKSMQGYKIVARISSFTGAMELRSQSKTALAFSHPFSGYSNPYDFLQRLKALPGLSQSIYHQLFAKIQYQILNRDGFGVSGGERSEFNLLNEIAEAQKYEMLLIDEPESSFDNIFLRNEVNKIIKEISQNMPVVLVTHNNTVGASIKPDYILHTKKEGSGKNIKYKVYAGFPTDPELMSMDGSKVKSFEIVMGCLEAGESTYEERKRVYESLKN